jgi:hypothetical protein
MFNLLVYFNSDSEMLAHLDSVNISETLLDECKNDSICSNIIWKISEFSDIDITIIGFILCRTDNIVEFSVSVWHTSRLNLSTLG